MLIRVVVDSPAEFERWLENESQPAVEDPAVQRGQGDVSGTVVRQLPRVRGTPARGTYAPDLTHLMSRKTLASGMVENTPDNLADWVRDPQTIKPGCLMPAFGLSRAQSGIDRALSVDASLTIRLKLAMTMSSLVEPTRSIELAGRPGEHAADLSWTALLHEWSTTVDHKKIGIMYVLMAIVFLVIGGVEALLMRWQLFYPA